MLSAVDFVWWAGGIFKRESFVNYFLGGKDWRQMESRQWEELEDYWNFCEWEKGWMPELRDKWEGANSGAISGVELTRFCEIV